MGYIGNPLVYANFPRDTFTGDGTTTGFTLSNNPGSANAIVVTQSGVIQRPTTDYTQTGTTLTFVTAPNNGSSIHVVYLGVRQTVPVPADGSLTDAAHGNRTGGTLHSTVTSGTAGFMSGQYLIRLNRANRRARFAAASY